MDSQRRVGMFRESPGSDIVKQGYLKKLKTMKKKYFVLRSTSSSGPARLDYFDSEKKFKTSHPPKKSYHLYTFFNINKKTDSKHKFVIAIFLPTEVFSVIAENNEEQEKWIDKLLEFQNEYLPEDAEPRIHYDYVWQGTIKHKSPASLTKISGPYRLCLSDKAVSLVKVGEYQFSYQFQLSTIRKCGAHEHFFLMEVGRSAKTGSGDIWLEAEGSLAAQNMHDVILGAMADSRNSDESFRRRSNTGSGVPPHSRGGESHIRSRTKSDSHHGSPNHIRAIYTKGRPQSTVEYSKKGSLGFDGQIPLGSSPSAFDHSLLEDMRERSSSLGSRSSRTSHHFSDVLDHGMHDVSNSTPVISPDGSFISMRSTTPETPYSIEEEDGEQSDGLNEHNRDYLPMDHSQRSTTPSPPRTRPSPPRLHASQGNLSDRSRDRFSTTPGKNEPNVDYLPMTPGKAEKVADFFFTTPKEKSGGQDYLKMTPGANSAKSSQGDYLPMNPSHRSGTPSPTRFSDRPGSTGSHSRDSSRDGRGEYMDMDMRPGSSASSPASSIQDASYMNLSMTPPKSSSYMDMSQSTPPVRDNHGYIDMNPGQRTPTDPGPGYVLMDGAWVRTQAVPIPIRGNKEPPGYMDMGPLGPNQPLPTVKESGSGEAYLPMSPTGQGISSEGLKPAKVISYLSEDSMSGEFPKRAYSVGSRPISKQPLRYHHQPEILRRQPLDNSMSSSAPHLMAQKPRSQFMDIMHHKNLHPDGSYGAASPLSTSVKSDDSDSFVEMDFYRPRTASDSYGCRPRSSSFGKQFMQGHRNRSSSFGHGAKAGMSKLATESYESVRTTSQEWSNRQRSQESLGIMSGSSRNSSKESLKNLSDSSQGKKSLGPGEYMDMNYDKNKSQSQGSSSVMSPKNNATGYMDMTLGSSGPKSLSHGISPCSSTHSLSATSSHILGSSPGGMSLGHSHPIDKTQQGAKVIKPSGKVAMQKQASKTAQSAADNQLKVSVPSKKGDKRSPSSSGKESEDESYVPFQPTVTSPSASHEDIMTKLHGQPSFEHLPKAHPGIKIQHGYSRSYDSGVRSPEAVIVKSPEPVFVKSPEPVISKINPYADKLAKGKKEEKHAAKREEHVQEKSKHERERKLSEKERKANEKERKGSHKKSPKSERSKHKNRLDSDTSLQDKAIMEDCFAMDQHVEFIPEDDLFSDKVFHCDPNDTENQSSPVRKIESKKDDSSYLDYNPGFETTLPKIHSQNQIPDVKSPVQHMKEFVPKHYVEREYCEIDFSGNSDNVLKSTDKSVRNKDSDYMEADPAPLAQVRKEPDKNMSNPISEVKDSIPVGQAKEVKSSTSVSRIDSPGSTDFSYMDFDPATEKKTECDTSGEETVKAPQRVRSFVAHMDEMETDQADVNTATSQDAKGCQRESKPTRKISRSSSSSCKTEIVETMDSKGNRVKSRENSGEKSEGKNPPTGSIRKESCSVCQVVKETEGTGQGQLNEKTVIDENKENEQKECCLHGTEMKGESATASCKVHNSKERHMGKLIIKQIQPSIADGKPIQDEGYCDLDFGDKDGVFVKGHKRSGSTSSSNSDRSRKLLDSVGSEDGIPCPETPISYISEESDDQPFPDTPLSYISDDSSNSSVSSSREFGSPFKSPLGARSSNPTVNKSFGLASFGMNAETLRKSFPTSKGVAQGVPSGGLSRQTSAPMAPAISPRSSGDMQQHAYRTRKASGPAVLTSQRKSTSSSASGTPTRTSTSSLDPAAGQELHKQKSMPSMNLPQNIENMCPDSESIEHVHSRHSFTDLSQYQEMNFPGSSISTGNQNKYSSQQQLNSEASTGSATSNELHYADLDLNGSNENVDGISPRVVKSRNPTSLDDVSKVQYAEIDHLKTERMKSTGEKDVKFYVN